MPESTYAEAPFQRDTARGDTLAHYPVLSARFDEMCASPGAVRSHWQYALRAFDALGPAELSRRRDEVQQVLRENGVTYNVYTDPQGRTRPWALDVIPALLTSQEWRTIEQGLIQRAELLNLIGADLYGSQQLIHDGLLPPELIYTHPGFLRPCHGALPTPTPYLCLYAADLARVPDGTIMVLDDRTQAPSGAGYALENRLVLSRILPSLYRDAQVHRLSLFFRTLRSTLAALAPSHQTRTTLLTPGPQNETYFEHAYLASYLDYTLAQGDDLTVRDGRLWLKTVGGLQQVGAVIRRVDDTFCDPLELHRESLLAPPGLLQAVRNNTVVVANPLGSGVLENPGLMAYLPQIAKVLLGQDLRLASVPTWWCGDEQARSYVVDHIEQMVIKSVFPHPGTATIHGAQLSIQERDTLIQNIRARPHFFVGQEQVVLSTTPVLSGGHLEPRPMVLRSFLVSRDDGYVAMPGGLTRVAPDADGWLVSGQAGGLSKDTWILASEPESQFSLIPAPEQSVSITRSGGEVPSRMADNLFWLGRYVERIAGGARVFREVLQRVLDTETARYDTSLSAFLSAHTHSTATYLRFIGYGERRRLTVAEKELFNTILDADRPGSLRFHLNALVHAGQAARGRLSDDAWRAINRLDHELAQVRSLSEMLESLERLIIGLASVNGLNTESMARGHGFRFMEIGRRLERALYTLSLLRTGCELPYETEKVVWEMVLAMTDSLMTYRRRYASAVQAGAVLDLLLLDESNPRSVGYQIVQIRDQVVGLPRRKPRPHRSAEERIVLEALTTLQVTDLERYSTSTWDEDMHEALSQLFAGLSTRLLSLSETLSRDYFSHIEVQQQLTATRSTSR